MNALGRFVKALSLLPPRVDKRREWPFKASLDFQGIPIDIEQRKGDSREGVDKDGTPWKVTMKAHYGEVRRVRGTEGAKGMDGDRLDVYVGPDEDSPLVVVIDQRIPETGEFDEQKVMLGFATIGDALALYRSQYTKPGFLGGHKTMTIDALKTWMGDKGNAGKALAKADSPPEGYSPIPGSAHGGYHIQRGGVWHTWYPSHGGSPHPQEKLVVNKHNKQMASHGDKPLPHRRIVRDEDGAPISLYQGNKHADVWDKPEGGREHGIYTTPKRGYAANYGPNVHKFHARARRPLYVYAKSDITPRDLTPEDAEFLKQHGYDSIVSIAPGRKLSQAEEIVFLDGDQIVKTKDLSQAHDDENDSPLEREGRKLTQEEQRDWQEAQGRVRNRFGSHEGNYDDVKDAYDEIRKDRASGLAKALGPYEILLQLAQAPAARVRPCLQALLAATWRCAQRAQRYHWNVTGPTFGELHALFGAQYDEANTAVDEIAERLKALGMAAVSPGGSVPEPGESTTDTAEMLHLLRMDHEECARLANECAGYAEAAKDAATVDLAGRRAGAHEKAAWMLRATLGDAPIEKGAGVKTAADEADWDRAKQIVDAEHGGHEGQWALVQHIYQQIKRARVSKGLGALLKALSRHRR